MSISNTYTRVPCMPSMIHSARPTVQPVVITILTWNLFCFARFWKVETDGWKYRFHVRKWWLWVGLVDHYSSCLLHLSWLQTSVAKMMPSRALFFTVIILVFKFSVIKVLADEQQCDLSNLCGGGKFGNDENLTSNGTQANINATIQSDCLIGRFAICNGRCQSPQFPILAQAGLFYSEEELQSLAPFDIFKEICVSGKESLRMRDLKYMRI